ncbi:MAG TPA: GNAT family N-acetyltransferase [Anaerolineae bacterium]|nr:GNAT family N-acetyltransferase [Anaerolineae bacterium]HQI83874.1 GNAT family N-acetyltransferase [Anaerolineae bacterium]
MMTNVDIRLLRPGDETALEAFLAPRLATSMFLIGNMRLSGLAYNGERYTGDYVAAFEDGNIVGVAAHFWNGIIITQAPAYLDALWRAALTASGRPLKGVIGPHKQVAVIKAALELEHYERQLDQQEKLYSLDLAALLVPEALATGQVKGRRVEGHDADILTRWRVGYDVETLGEEESEQLWAQERAMAERITAEGNTWILEAEDRPVATSAFNTRLREAVQIGGVWTPPEYRRRGYARCVVAQSLLDARAEGVEKAILFTGEDNLAAQKAYTSLGFRHIGDYHLLMLRNPLNVAVEGNPTVLG